LGLNCFLWFSSIPVFFILQQFIGKREMYGKGKGRELVMPRDAEQGDTAQNLSLRSIFSAMLAQQRIGGHRKCGVSN
jgi:hypothetical protein